MLRVFFFNFTFMTWINCTSHIFRPFFRMHTKFRYQKRRLILLLIIENKLFFFNFIWRNKDATFPNKAVKKSLSGISIEIKSIKEAKFTV